MTVSDRPHLQTTGHSETLTGCVRRRVCSTWADSFNRKCGLSQEVGVWEHVLLKHHEAQEGELRLAHGEADLLRGGFPHRVQAVITCRGQSRGHVCSKASSCSHPVLTVDGRLKLLLRLSTELHLHERAGDAAAQLGKMPGSDNLQNRNAEKSAICRPINGVCVYVCVCLRPDLPEHR